MSTGLAIRAAELRDADLLASFNIAMARETENVALEPATVGAGVRAALADPVRASYFVAEIDGTRAGSCMITREWSDWRNGDIWWIQSVYVAPEFRRRGVFAALYRHVCSLAAKQGVRAIRLYVEKHNSAAQETYFKMGMRLTDYWVMESTPDLKTPASPANAGR